MTDSTIDNSVSRPNPLKAKSKSIVLQCEVWSKQIRFHLLMLKHSMPPLQLLLVPGIVLLAFRTAEPLGLLDWDVLTFAVVCLSAVYAKVLSKREDTVESNSAHHQLILLAYLVSAIAGLNALVFTLFSPLPTQVLLGLILFSIPLAAVSVTAFSWPIMATFSFFILAPIIVTWETLYPNQSYTVAGLTVLYWLFIISTTADRDRSASIRRERDRAVQDLEGRNAKAIEEKATAEHFSRSRAHILAAASHDLRQPLHALSVYSAVLASNPEPDVLPEVAGNIDRLVRSLGGLLHGLLDLSRLSAECFVAERKRISLERLVGDICDEFELNSENKHVRLIRELNQVRLFDDPIAIARITRNLLDNAFKYTSNGHVLIRTHSMDGLAFLSVEDTGKGIPLSEQKRVFEEFYQMDNYDHDQSKGAGLGLAIIQRLCEVIGAKISLVSELGLGSKFSVLFNSVCVGNDSSYKKAVKSTDLMCLQGKNIYVLDDEIDILDSMCMLLNSWGIQVKTANSPEAAEALFKKSGKPDLFIVDLWLQGEKFGLELANRFKEKYGYFSVLAVTGETTLAPLGKTDAAKYPLLLKPINSEILYDAISKGLTTVLHPIDCAELCPIDCFQKKHPAPKAEPYSGFIDGGHSGLLTARTGC